MQTEYEKHQTWLKAAASPNKSSGLSSTQAEQQPLAAPKTPSGIQTLSEWLDQLRDAMDQYKNDMINQGISPVVAAVLAAITYAMIMSQISEQMFSHFEKILVGALVAAGAYLIVRGINSLHSSVSSPAPIAAEGIEMADQSPPLSSLPAPKPTEAARDEEEYSSPRPS